VSWPGSVCPGRRMARHPVSGHGGVAVSFGGSPGGRSSPRREVRDLDHLVSLRQVCAPRRHGAAAGRTSLALDTRDLARVPAPPARPTPPERWRCAHDNARRLSKSGGRQSHALRKTAPVGAWGHRRVPASQGDRCHSTQEGPHGASPDDGIPVRWRPPNRVGTGGTPVLGESSETSARSVGSHPDDGPSLRPSPGLRHHPGRWVDRRRRCPHRCPSVDPDERGFAGSTGSGTCHGEERGDTEAKAEVDGAQETGWAARRGPASGTWSERTTGSTRSRSGGR
jgi:hypothetical protein